ncbi:MAG: hypothetical protein H0T92_13885 [Pyrinomonadaceae bacterium]|nr:hypothetical protein [Pyrinomonadaceae bacterium]
MQNLHIRKLKATYRLPSSSVEERARLDRVLTTILNRELEATLEQINISSDEELCIRSIYVPIRLRLSSAESTLSAEWSMEIAKAIEQILERGYASGVVRYKSRVQAFIDFAVGVALGDLERSWAWRQLGLWRARDRVGDEAARRELIRALIEEPTMIIPVLCALAKNHTLERLAFQLTTAHWQALTSAALSAAQAASSLEQLENHTGLISPVVLSEARRIVNRSLLAKSLIQQIIESTAVNQAVAVMVILEVNPGIFRAGGQALHTLLSAVMNRMVEPISGAAQIAPAHHDEEAMRESLEEAHTGAAPSDQTLFRQTSISDSTLTSDERPLPIVRQRALTRFGGLLYLIGVVDDLCLPEAILVHPSLKDRPFRWVMHQLALALVPATTNDAAALAFAGLLPDASPPSAGEDPSTSLEEETIQEFAKRITVSLRERLAYKEQSAASLIEFVCHRRAEIVADPGWIETGFSLDEVSTEIRRAGLDLDPGYVPWLGVVVKFIYLEK